MLSAIGLGIALTVAYLPIFFSYRHIFDDEGSLLVAISRFLHHGHLYTDTHGSYGPFYFSSLGAVFRLTGHDPTLFVGRIVVVVFTALAAGMFAATVWRLTGNLLCSLLCEVATYCVLASVAGNEPIHPGSMIILLLAVLTYALASYIRKPSTGSLVVSGFVVGAVLMTKVNIGILIVAALFVSFVVGNQRFPKWFRSVVAVAALLLPFAVMSQLLYQALTAQFAAIVAIGLLLTYAPLSVDSVSIPGRALLVMSASAVATMALSCIWPLASGTSLRALFHGVVIQPLGQTSNLALAAPVSFQWLMFLLAACAALLVLHRRDTRQPTPPPRYAYQWEFALAAAAIVVLGMVVFGSFASWLPAIALLPCLAWVAGAREPIRLALRFTVPLVVLQLVHAYPVAGSQVAWARVAACVPCTIALAAALDRIPLWTQLGAAIRVLAVGSLGLVLLVVGFWPGATWHTYAQQKRFDLPGARFVAADPPFVDTVRDLTRILQRDCDTFYSAPPFDSLYIFTGMTPPTGLLANARGALEVKEQRQLVNELASAQASGRRVCVVRDERNFGLWYLGAYQNGPLGKGLAAYSNVIARSGDYSVSVFGPGSG